jgi:hypothetical protein
MSRSWVAIGDIHGHCVSPKPQEIGNRVNINTGCGCGGYLTALVLPEKIYLSSGKTEGEEHDWARLRKCLEAELEELASE